MPLEALVPVNTHQTYAIWHITESEETLRKLLATNINIAPCNAITHPRKRREWLATRLAYQHLCEEIDVPFLPMHKNSHGRPYVEVALQAKQHFYISLSHSFPFAGAIISTDTPIGIDIEKLTDRLLRIQAKYLTPTEIMDCNADITKSCIYWSAKEAIYKAYIHAPSLALSSIQVLPFIQAETGALQGYTPSGHQYIVHYTIHQDYVLTWGKENC